MPLPLIGRTRALAHLLELLSDGGCSGVLLVGPAGIGKSALAQAACAELQGGGRRTLELPTMAQGALPSAALLGLVDPGTNAPMLDQMVATLDRLRTAAGPPVLVCDDVDALAGRSQQLLLSVAQSGDCQLLATRRSDHVGPAPVGSIEDGLEAVPLRGLDDPSTQRLASTVAGGRIGGVTGARLHADTLGNPLHVVETVRLALDTGALHPDPDGTLRARADLPLAVGLSATIDARLSRLDPTQRRAVELVALGQPLQADHLRRATVDRGIVEALRHAGLVTHGSDGVTLSHPLQTERILAQLPAARRRRHLGRLLAAIDADPRHDRIQRVQFAVWQAELGGPVDDDARVHAARTALTLDQPETASMLIEPSRTLEAELVRAELDAVGNRPAAALERLHRLQPRSMADRARIALVESQVRLLSLGEVDAASRALEAVSGDALPTATNDELTAARALLLLLAGRPGDSAHLGAGVDPAASPRNAVEVWVSSSIAEMLAGDLVTAARQARDGLAALTQLTDPGVLPFAEVQLGCTLVYADLYAGRINAAVRRCRTYQSDHLRSGGAVAGLWSSMRGTAELLAGNLTTARDVASDAVAVTRARDPLGHGGLTLADNALASAMLGERGAARQLLAELEHRPDAATPRVAVNLARVRAWVAALEEDIPTAVDHALSGSREAAAAGYHSWAMLAAHDAVRFGAAEAALPLLEMSARGLRDARFLELLLDHARASVEDDRAGLEQVADDLLAVGARLHAAEVLRQATALSVQLGDSRHATALARRIAALGTGGAWTLRDMPSSEPLTRREHQVAEQAARGRSNRAIAASLGVSHRTVENHLTSVYGKLGITGRDGLTRQLIDATSTDT